MIYCLFPPRCLYSISEDDIFKTETYPSQTKIDKYSNEISSEFIEKLEFINISEIRYELLLSNWDFQFISDIISSPNIQINLRKVDLTTNNLNESLRLLNLLSEWKNLESIELKYRGKLVYDIWENEIGTIRKAINEFYKKAGVISKVKIYHKE